MPGKALDVHSHVAGTKSLQDKRCRKKVLQHNVLLFWGDVHHPRENDIVMETKRTPRIG
jgi:hypothetical protein